MGSCGYRSLLGSRVLGFWGLGCTGLGFRVWGLGFGFWGLGFRVWEPYRRSIYLTKAV